MNLKTIKVTLVNSVKINDKNTKTIILREPKSGELRGLSLVEVTQLNTGAICTLIPRISDLTATHMANMNAMDLLTISGELMSFFVDAKKFQNA